MSWWDRARLADHFSATSHARGEADQSYEVRHAAGRRHRLRIQRLQAGRVTACTQTSSRRRPCCAWPLGQRDRTSHDARLVRVTETTVHQFSNISRVDVRNL